MQAIGITQNEAERTHQSDGRQGGKIPSNVVNAPNMIINDNPLLITANSHVLRSGKQVKLILGNERNQAAVPNRRLVAMVAKTRHWFNGLKSGRYPTIKEISIEEKCDKSYVGRPMSIAFLAPILLNGF